MPDSAWYRCGQAAGLWRVTVHQRGVLAGTGLWILIGFFAFVARQTVHDVRQAAEGRGAS